MVSDDGLTFLLGPRGEAPLRWNFALWPAGRKPALVFHDHQQPPALSTVEGFQAAAHENH